MANRDESLYSMLLDMWSRNLNVEAMLHYCTIMGLCHSGRHEHEQVGLPLVHALSVTAGSDSDYCAVRVINQLSQGAAMTTINLVFFNTKSKRLHSVPVTSKSEAQSIVNVLNKKSAIDIRISYNWDNVEHVAYAPVGKNYRLTKV